MPGRKMYADNYLSPEMHFMPILDESGNPVASRNMQIASARAYELLPRDIAVSSDGRNIAFPEYIAGRTPKEQFMYKWFGIKNTQKEFRSPFSTDILDRMEGLQKKGKGEIVKSATGYVDRFNTLGVDFEKNYAKYFGTPNHIGHVLFKDMTPWQVIRFNLAHPKTPINIFTRKMIAPMFRKTE